MAKFLTAPTLKSASERLIQSRAKSGFVDFLVLKRSFIRGGNQEIPFSSKNVAFTESMRDLAATFPLSSVAATPNGFQPFVKVWGTANAEKYISQKWQSNGPAVTLAGSKWSASIRISGSKPRRGSLTPSYMEDLPGLILKANGPLPGLLDSALWYFRGTDVEGRLGAIADVGVLCQRLREAFIGDLGLTDEEQGLLFDKDADPLNGMDLTDILQNGVADPREYLPDLNVGSGNLHELVASFVGLANGDNVGLRVPERLFLRFAAALGSKRFLILSGLAGSGKTKLAQAFARWLSPLAEDGDPETWVLVPVGADWTGSDAVLGYPDGLDPKRYVTRPALELIQRAMLTEGDGTPHFLILDEMNLSHVERYFADMLSLIESGDTTELYQPERDDAGNLRFRSDVDPVLRLPSNLFIIGTVNVDETTYMFSPKVLDRANVIEFRAEREDIETFLKNPCSPTLEGLNSRGDRFGPAFVAESARSLQVPSGVQNLFQEEMLLFFDLLTEHQAEFGYRVANEAARFMHFYRVLAREDEASAEWFPAAMDAVIVQKLLPKLHGSRTKLEGLLWSLAYACGAERGDAADSFTAKCKMAGKAEDEKTYSPENIYAALQAKSPDKPLKAARYPLSFEKILRMYRKLIRDQFVTFAEA